MSKFYATVAVAAQQHDTSVREIEAHYAAYILDHSDALSRRALLDTAQTVAPDLVLRPAKPHAADTCVGSGLARFSRQEACRQKRI
jgi:hypothetical protein